MSGDQAAGLVVLWYETSLQQPDRRPSCVAAARAVLSRLSSNARSRAVKTAEHAAPGLRSFAKEALS